ncbi:uncharacterized protein G2W53_019413 [Senna tora]|uniref:Uncharacterized protein n=1 Tax=Senna tora TaxID=362788 RepID=A0A834TUV7_9FABA|nr:uncharacterized protein G2W53_019413 [Senna tora]
MPGRNKRRKRKSSEVGSSASPEAVQNHPNFGIHAKE